MTLAEISRAIESKRRVYKLQLQERASFDYILADLIGKSIARIHSSSNHMPPIQEVYPTIFEAAAIEEQVQTKKDEVSMIRFKQFADSFNKRFKKEASESK